MPKCYFIKIQAPRIVASISTVNKGTTLLNIESFKTAKFDFVTGRFNSISQCETSKQNLADFTDLVKIILTF